VVILFLTVIFLCSVGVLLNQAYIPRQPKAVDEPKDVLKETRTVCPPLQAYYTSTPEELERILDLKPSFCREVEV